MEQAFTQEILSAVRICKEQLNYTPTRFIQMINDIGTLNACKRLLENQDGWQEGFGRLILAGRPDLTIESFVIKPEYAALFTEQEIAIAHQRLKGILISFLD